MTNKELSEIICVIDRSGSMAPCQDDAIGGFNTFLKDQREAKIGECRLTLVLFDHEYNVLYDGKPIEEVPELNHDTYQPRGATALLDAIGQAINVVGERLHKTPEGRRPGAVIFVVLTDGYENASREFSYSTIQRMIKEQTDRYSWQFVFLGQSIDAEYFSQRLGVDHANPMHYVASAPSGGGGQIRMAKCAAAVSIGTRYRGASGQSVNCDMGAKEAYSYAMDSNVSQEASEDLLNAEIDKARKAYVDYRAQQSEVKDSTSGSEPE